MLEILTPCRDQSHEEEHCAVHCPELNEPKWNEFLGGWYHVVQLLTPQERTARAHAQQQREEFVDQKVREAAERIRTKTADYERRTTGGFIEFLEFNMPSPEQWVREHLRTEPSDPGTTMPPQLDP